MRQKTRDIARGPAVNLTTRRRTMTLARFTSCLLLAVFAVVLGAAPAMAQQKIPPDFVLEKSKDSPGPVNFSHEKHKAAGVEKCTACHTKVFKMKKGQTGAASMTMAKMKAGESCGVCHNGKPGDGGKVVFGVDDKAKCESCHKKS
jgi:c(7)-type cytochrome triheme protein